MSNSFQLCPTHFSRGGEKFCEGGFDTPGHVPAENTDDEQTFFLLHLLSQFFNPLLGRTRSRARCCATIRLSHRPESPGRAVHGKVDGLDIGRQRGRRFVLLRHTHRPQRRPYPICTSRGPRLFLSLRVGAGFGDENAESRSALQPLRIPSVIRPQCAARMLLLSDKQMSCCAAGTNGCLDLRRRASPLDGRVSAEWSRCLGSMARRARDSVTPLRRSSAGWIPARIGRLSAGVGRRHPVTIRKASLMVGSMRRV